MHIHRLYILVLGVSTLFVYIILTDAMSSTKNTYHNFLNSSFCTDACRVYTLDACMYVCNLKIYFSTINYLLPYCVDLAYVLLREVGGGEGSIDRLIICIDG